uniref:PHD-type domain-containing protein n=1 Tax=Ciona savignyi TaxID=51511 RepID=H2Y8K4_CIOSA
RKLCGVFKEGHDVLVRWSDGLYYLGTVFKVTFIFEDKSMFWAQFKDLQMINNKDGSDNGVDSDVTCSICHDGVSDPPNEIVLCDKCGQGYHQLCHIPAIDTSILNDEDTPWQCRTCVFAAVAKRGGAESDGPAAATLRVYKQVLPYDLKSLTWDKGHKVNHEELYCYCGGPGDWYLKMLQCCRCQQWFHEACMQCLETPFLYGDRFFLFICSICNHGSEYVKRLPMRWVDVVHLVLYNITIAKLVKYYDFQSTMMPFFVQNWEELQLGDVGSSTRSQLKERVLETLQNNKSRFQCGSESKKAK